MARALAATASKAGTKVSFFMRKGADVLSKWVGEAERQLRLLFEEAQKAQPSIIFFDEIDGLAPVCSPASFPFVSLSACRPGASLPCLLMYKMHALDHHLFQDVVCMHACPRPSFPVMFLHVSLHASSHIQQLHHQQTGSPNLAENVHCFCVTLTVSVAYFLRSLATCI